jgi:uracil-DNA glycosylase family 4
MMATAELIRAYLDWQSEMGSDEVVLPQPLAKRAAAHSTSSGASAGAPGVATTAGAQADAGRHGAVADPMASMAALAALAAQTGQAPGGQPRSGFSPPMQGSGANVAADLYASLTQALNKSPDSRIGDSGAGVLGRASLRGPEAVSLPAFPDLAAFWDHLERAPGLVSGDLGGASELSIPADGSKGAALRLVRGMGPVKAPLALVGFDPGDADVAESRPFQGEPGALLEKMMRAIRLDTRELYQTLLIKVRVSGKVWSRRELNRVIPLLHAELGLAQAPMVLLFGQECAQAVLKTGKTLDELRQETHRMEGREFFVTYHPAELLRKEELKRKAWEDLQWLQRRMAQENGQARP